MTKITINRSTVEFALEALEWHYRQGHSHTLGGLRLKIDEKALRNLKAALAEPVQEPPMWKLVPTEPTIGMCIAGDEARQNVDDLTRTPAIYRAMIAAAPAAPQQAEPVQEPVAQAMQDAVVYGMGIFHGGKRIDPDSIYKKAEPVQEPVAWMYTGIKQDGTEHGPHLVWKPVYMDAMSASKGVQATPLYAAPPQRPAEPVQEPVYNDLLRLVGNLFDEAYKAGQAAATAQPKAAEKKLAVLAEPQEPDLSRCPKCTGPADNGHDREVPPNPYVCTKCMAEPVEPVEPVALDWLHKWANQDDGEPETQWHEGYEAARRVVQIHLTAPPQRPVEPLTDDAMQKVFTDSFGLCPEPGGFLFRVGRAVERAHKIGGEG